MECNASSVSCIVLRGVQNDVQGTARLEELPAGLRVTAHAEGLSPDAPVRLLLLSAGEEGAALDLGGADSTAAGIVHFTHIYPPVDLHLWDALALAEDWPSGRLAAAGWLRLPSGPVWRLAEAAARFLRIPPLM